MPFVQPLWSGAQHCRENTKMCGLEPALEPWSVLSAQLSPFMLLSPSVGRSRVSFLKPNPLQTNILIHWMRRNGDEDVNTWVSGS